MNVGRVIFYDKITGQVIIDTGEWSNVSKKKTIEQQIESYKKLSELNRETFDYIELEYKQFENEFSSSSGYRVDVEKKKILFLYENNVELDFEKPSIAEQILSEIQYQTALLEIQLLGGE